LDDTALTNLIAACERSENDLGFHRLAIRLENECAALLASGNEQAFKTLQRGARLLACRAPQSFGREHVPQLISVLLSSAVAHIPRASPGHGIFLAQRAYEFASCFELAESKRRALNICSALSIYLGAPADAVEYGIESARLAHALDYELAVANSLGNVTAALTSMGLYREVISLSLRVEQRYGRDEAFDQDVAIASTNLASAALCLNQAAVASDAALRACNVFAKQTDAHTVVNRIAAENILLKAAIALDQPDVVANSLMTIRGLDETFKTPRTKLNRQLAEAAHAMYKKEYITASEILVRLSDATRDNPPLFVDAMQLLVNLSERVGDHSAAVRYLGELVNQQSQAQFTKVAALLRLVDETMVTPMPGKDFAQGVIDRMPRGVERTDDSSQHGIPAIGGGSVPEARYAEAIERLAITAELRDDPSGRHIYRVGKLSGLLALELGYSDERAETLEFAARLHDIGKLGIPNSILIKAGSLNEAEFEAMTAHTRTGATMLSQCEHPAFALAADIALSHHETWEGSGYPNTLAGDAIPEAARIVALTETYDSLIHTRTYKHAWSHRDAIDYMKRCTGSQFDPRIADAFFPMIERIYVEQGATIEGLDAFLAVDAKHSRLIRTRDTMLSMIAELVPPRDGSNMFDLAR
jgi:putative two-component system response regulator